MQAGRFDYRPGEAGRHHACVKSRMVLRCVNGKGRVKVNGTVFPLALGELLFLPWAHEIRYLPDRDESFGLSGLHIVPEFTRSGSTFSYGIPHFPHQSEFDNPDRRDCGLPGLEGVVRGWAEPNDPLNLLGDYAVRLFQGPDPEEWVARHLAQLVLAELAKAIRRPSTSPASMPSELSRAQAYVRSHLDEQLTVPFLASLCGCSASTLTRQFRTHLKESPVGWMLTQRLNRAAHLLRTTSMRVKEVAARSGFEDSAYFCRRFKIVHTLSPREFRRHASLL